MIRYVILSLLFVVGPIAWVFGLSDVGMGAVRGWFRNTWQVSFWLVVFSTVKAAIIPLGLSAFQSGVVSGIAVSVVFAFVIVTMVLLIPTLTAAIFSDSNLHSIGSALTGAIVSFATLRSVVSTGSGVHKGIWGAAGFGAGIKSAYGAGGMKGVLKALASPKGPAAAASAASSGGSVGERTR